MNVRIHLSVGEVCLRAFGRRMGGLIPECRQREAPAKGWSTVRAARLL
jgi:hypothetical protein